MRSYDPPALPRAETRGERSSRRRINIYTWLGSAVLVTALPFLAGLSTSRLFYIRDLSLYFWARHLWLRRTLAGGEWPLWDPFVGAGQSAAADALHQMFLLPVLAIRSIGSDVLSFNLWVLLPFPLAACGAWLFFARRFSPSAAALGAVVFGLCGPVVSTGNFPNMSWSVAAMPWVMWAVDRTAANPGARSAGLLALVVAFQALAGEPVSFTATGAVAFGLSLIVPVGERQVGRMHRVAWVAGGLMLGVALSAIQLVPMIEAAGIAERSKTIIVDVWSLHPLALVEMILPHVFGDYYAISSLVTAPWMPLVNTGREPFFFSLYFGVPVLSLAIFGLVALGRSGWGVFWAAAGGASMLLAFGVYTPVYPFLRDHLPLVASFRFPVKYLVVFSLSVAAGAAAGWDAVCARGEAGDPSGVAARARIDAVAFAAIVGVLLAALWVAAMSWPDATVARASSVAEALFGLKGSTAGRYMLRALPAAGKVGVPLCLAAAALLFLATRPGALSRGAQVALYVLICGDLLVRAWSVNPVFDARYLAEPAWLTLTKADSNARFYVGGKKDGTLEAWDLDASRGYFNAPGLTGSASRAALSGQTAYYPSAWRGREMLAYDLPVLWPKLFDVAYDRFYQSEREARDLFLDRTGVRYRVLPERWAAGHAPLVKIPYYLESYLYDWGEVQPRVTIVRSAVIVPDPYQQMERLFQGGWNARETVILEREPAEAGIEGQSGALAPAARIVTDRTTETVVEADVPQSGAYFLFLDSYSPDWHATVDGRTAPIVRANGLFRALRLAPGHHVVRFVYRPRALMWGAAISGISVLLAFALVARKQPGLAR